jgi:hypothetical protein
MLGGRLSAEPKIKLRMRRARIYVVRRHNFYRERTPQGNGVIGWHSVQLVFAQPDSRTT